MILNIEEKKLNPFVRIRGNKERGAEVIAELEKRGGMNYCSALGDNERLWYYISPYGRIEYVDEKDSREITQSFFDNYEEIMLPEPVVVSRWRAEYCREFWFVHLDVTGRFCAEKTIETDTESTNGLWENCNYFRTEEEAMAMADKFNKELHDEAFKTNEMKDLRKKIDAIKALCEYRSDIVSHEVLKIID